MKNQPDELKQEIARLKADKKDLKKALKQSQQRFIQLFHSSSNPITINTLKDGRIIDLNEAYARIGGFQRKELIGRSSVELGLWADPGQRDNLLQELQKKGTVHNFEMDVLTKAKETRKLLLSVNPIDMGIEPCLLIMAVDLTEIMQRSDALIKSEEKYRKLVENSLQGLAIYQGNRIVFCNKTHADIFGYSVDELLTLEESTKLIHPGDRDLVFGRYKDLLAGKSTPAHYEHRIIRKDGEQRWIEIYASLIEYNGKPASQVVSMDVTERKKSEETLKESMDYLDQIINCISDPVFVKDYQHRLVLVNEAFSKFSGIPREKLLGKTGIDLLRESYTESFHEQETEVFLTGKENVSQATLPDAEGNERIVMTKKTLLTKKGGEKQIVGVSRDITDYKKLEAQFLQAQKMEAIGALAGGVAHDFNNLLTVITGYVDLLKQDHGHMDSSKNDLEQIERAVQHATSLTSQLLAFSRKQILNPRVIDLNKIISDMNPMIRRLIRENIEYETILTPDLGAIKADPAQIQQIIMNLVVNARDAMPGGGQLSVKTANVEIDAEFTELYSDAKAGPHILLTIGDNGIGMDETTRSRIFEPFFTTKETGKGTGLGLSTVYGIVSQSGGFIQINSEYRKGTVCRIYLPMEKAPTENPENDKNAISASKGKETVLVVEDETSVRILTGRILRKFGYHVMEAGNGEEALDLVRNYSGEIHLLLTDAIMPGMSGKELVAHVHAIRPGTRALYVSGYLDDTIMKQGILDSSIAFLQKPFAADDLIRKVQETIGA